MFCPTCRTEYREGYTRCADCDVELVAELPPEDRGLADLELERVFGTADPNLLPVVASALAAAGIPFMLEGEGVFALLPLTGGVVDRRHQGLGVRIRVPGERAEEARAVLTGEVGGIAAEPAEVSTPASAAPFFPVATHKFIVLSLCSFGLYQLYWCYQNWRRVKDASGEVFSPFLRGCFGPLWGTRLFARIRTVAASQGVATDWSTLTLGSFYFFFSFMWRLPEPWWLLCFGSIVAMVPVQQTTQRVNELSAGSTAEGRNGGYGIAAVATIAIGGLLLALVLMGIFSSE